MKENGMLLSFILVVKDKISKNFSALQHVNFRIFWFGQMISVIGTWMQSISLPWLTYTITGSPFLVGLVGAVQFTPMMVLSLFVGVLNDRHRKRKILIVTQSTLAISAMILAILVFTKTVQYWHIFSVAFIIGLAHAFDMPTRQSFVIELVGKSDLMNAIALNSAIFNSARIIGPAIAGVVMATFNIGYCFLFNSLSFIPVIVGLFFIRPYTNNNSSLKDEHILKSIVDGLKYIYSEKILLWVLLAVLVVGTFGMNFNVLVPVFAKTILGKGEKGFGLLMSCMGIGSFIGALTVASRSKKGPKFVSLAIFSVLTSILFIIIGFSRTFILTAIFIGLTGFSNTTFFTTANSTLQLSSNDKYRGRVVSVYTLFFSGSTPLGNIFAGYLSNNFGANYAFILSGIAILSLMIVFFILIFLKLRKNTKF